MKTLQEIKDEYAGEQGRDSWDEFFKYCVLIHSRLDTMQYHHDEIAKRFAIEVAKEALRNAANNARLSATRLELSTFQGTIDKESILSETNIPKI